MKGKYSNVPINVQDYQSRLLFRSGRNTWAECYKKFSDYTNPLINSKNFELNKNLEFKKNINLYISLQIIFPKRRCL